MCFWDVVFLLSPGSFYATFLENRVEVKAFVPPRVLKLWLVLSQGMLLLNTFTPTKPLFVSVDFFEDHKTDPTLR